jgi:hypothetical protein
MLLRPQETAAAYLQRWQTNDGCTDSSCMVALISCNLCTCRARHTCRPLAVDHPTSMGFWEGTATTAALSISKSSLASSAGLRLPVRTVAAGYTRALDLVTSSSHAALDGCPRADGNESVRFCLGVGGPVDGSCVTVPDPLHRIAPHSAQTQCDEGTMYSLGSINRTLAGPKLNAEFSTTTLCSWCQLVHPNP